MAPDRDGLTVLRRRQACTRQYGDRRGAYDAPSDVSQSTRDSNVHDDTIDEEQLEPIVRQIPRHCVSSTHTDLHDERNQRFRRTSIRAVLRVTRPKQPLLSDEAEHNHQRDHDAKGQGPRRCSRPATCSSSLRCDTTSIDGCRRTTDRVRAQSRGPMPKSASRGDRAITWRNLPPPGLCSGGSAARASSTFPRP